MQTNNLTYNPNRHHRKSIRLPGYDYSQSGAYFITVCAQKRECFFGEIADGEMRLNDAGKMIQKWHNELPNKFPDIELNEYVIMPNHFHCIILNIGTISVGTDPFVCPDNLDEHRNDLNRIRKYIDDNPANWNNDNEN